MSRNIKDNRTKKEKLLAKGKGKYSGFKFIDSLNLYTRLYSEKISGGLTDTPSAPLGETEFYYTSDRIFTRNGVKKIFFVHEMPSEIRRGFVTDIRHAINKAVFSYNQSNNLNDRVDVSLIIHAKYYPMDLSDKRTQGRWEYFTRQYESVQKKAGEKTLQDELKSDKYSVAIRRKVNSFLYIKEAKDVEDSSFYKTTIIFEFIATSNDVLATAEKAFANFIGNSGLITKPIFIQTNEYQKSYMPMANSSPTLLSKMHVGDVWTDDTLSSFSLTTHGIVGDRIGVYHGIDIESKLPITFDFSKGSNANNILLTAGTGEGKSNMAKMIYTFLIPLQDTYRTIVLDYEGGQFDALGKLANASIVSMTGGDGRYVNTMVIGDLTGDSKVDDNLKIEAITSTERIFNLLMDERYGMTKHQTSLFSDAINEVYLDFGVTDDPLTWKNSQATTFYHIYAKLVNYRNNNDKLYEYGHDEISEFIIGLKPYFEKGSIYTHWFKEPISITEILMNKHLIFNFGMGGQDEAMIDTKSLAIRQMFVSYLTNLIAGQNRAKNLRTVIFVEEMQRYLKQRYSGEILSAMSSGGRKLGMIVYYITNAPTELVQLSGTGVDENVRTHASTLISNMTMQIIGSLYRNDMDNLIDEFNLVSARDVLYELAKVKESNNGSSDLKYCFYIKYKGQSTVVRTLSHPALDNLPLYATVHDASNFTEYSKDGKLKMNVGEEAIKAKIQMAIDDEFERQEFHDELNHGINNFNDTMSKYNEHNIWSH